MMIVLCSVHWAPVHGRLDWWLKSARAVYCGMWTVCMLGCSTYCNDPVHVDPTRLACHL